MFRSIRSKALTFTLIPLVVTLLLIGFTAVINKQQSERELVIDRLHTYRELLESGDFSFESLTDKARLEELLGEKVEHAEIVKKDHTTAYSTDTEVPVERNALVSPLIDEAFFGIETTNSIEENGETLLLYISPLIVNEKIVGALRVDLSHEHTTARIFQFTAFIGILIIIGILLCYFLIAALLTSTILNGIEKLKNAASSLEQGDLNTKITSTSNDEIGGLAKILEKMRREVKSSHERLESANEDLEKQVADRTVQLQQKLDELERLNRFMVDREVKMVELKREVESLQKQLHR